MFCKRNSVVLLSIQSLASKKLFTLDTVPNAVLLS